MSLLEEKNILRRIKMETFKYVRKMSGKVWEDQKAGKIENLLKIIRVRFQRIIQITEWLIYI